MMNKKFVEKFDLITKKNKEFDEMEDELNELNDELLQIVTDIFRDDGVLEGDWDVAMDMIHIVFIPKKLKHKKLLSKYKRYVNEHRYRGSIDFWTTSGDPVTISLLDNYRMKLSMLNMTPENINKFLEDYKISVKKFMPPGIGLDIVKVSEIRDRLLEVASK